MIYSTTPARLYDPRRDAFITVSRERALAQARSLDAERKAEKWRGPLHGIPIALTDNIDGIRTTAGSEVFEDRVPTEDAPIGVVVGALTIPALSAQFRSAKVTRLITADLTGFCDGKEVIVELNEYGPGTNGKHYHPGH